MASQDCWPLSLESAGSTPKTNRTAGVHTAFLLLLVAASSPARPQWFQVRENRVSQDHQPLTPTSSTSSGTAVMLYLFR